ncbi:MAG: inosine monophosphate cyclohydrolase [Clostridiaceae bacterium]|nr:inosine monophosphate cyclohydrolase [Clostridiaceae bacterium]
MFRETADNNANKLSQNEYPGRGIVQGLTPDGDHLVQVYWIMGRSANSRNRVFVEEDGFVRTKAFDESKVVDPSLIIYYPVKYFDRFHIVSNGDQTDTVYDFLKSGKTFEEALKTRSFEPDAPNYTPRITGLIELNGKNAYSLSIIKTQSGNPDIIVRNFFHYEDAIPGFGHCIHTYKENGDVLPSFDGEPYLMPVYNTLDQNIEKYWDMLNEENIISLLVKIIDVKTGKFELKIKNKNI